MNFIVKPISPTHSVPRYRPRKIRDQFEFIEQAARYVRIPTYATPKNPPSSVDVSKDSQEFRFSAFG